MIYVGIDVAKQAHFASLISSDGEILVGPFQFSNDGDGFQYLFFVKYFSLKKASEFPFFSKGFSLPSAGIMYPCA